MSLLLVKSLLKAAARAADITISRFTIGGLKLLDKLSIYDIYQTIPELNIQARHSSGDSSLIKWEAMKSNLPLKEKYFSVLDIGCNIGLYSIKMASMGHFVTAIDSSTICKSVCYQASKILNLDNLAVGQMTITPKNIESLPIYDCIFFLNVFHHLCRKYGQETALDMLDHIYRKANMALFFETGQTDTASNKFVKALPDMGDSPKEWMIDLFMQKGAYQVKEICYVNGRHLMVAYKIKP